MGNKGADEIYDKIESGQLTVGPNGQLVESRASGRADYVPVEALLVPLPPILEALGIFKIAETVVEATTETALAKTGVEISKHATERMAERGITESMVETVLSKGVRYYDPKNGTINTVLRGGYASGKDLLVGTNALTGKVTTVVRGSKLINSRFIPIK